MSKIKKGDNVVVLTGRDKGKRGDVTRVAGDHVMVAGVNQVKKHQRPNPMKGEQGGIVTKEAPIHVSNVMHLCPKCQAGVHITVRAGSDGARERYCSRCGETIPRVI